MNHFRVLGLTVCVCMGSACWAQTREGHDRWLMQNYKFVTPPPPEPAEPATRAVADLQEIQNTLLTILRKANFAGDYEAALAAAAQAAANAQLIGRLTGQVKPVQPTRAPELRRPGSTGISVAARASKIEPQR